MQKPLRLFAFQNKPLQPKLQRNKNKCAFVLRNSSLGKVMLVSKASELWET